MGAVRDRFLSVPLRGFLFCRCASPFYLPLQRAFSFCHREGEARGDSGLLSFCVNFLEDDFPPFKCFCRQGAGGWLFMRAVAA